MSICRRSFLSVFISCSGSLWMPTQQPLTKILVALQTSGMTSRVKGQSGHTGSLPVRVGCCAAVAADSLCDGGR